ncbi:MAG: hypothetical protein O2840_04600, partial [bacterium]|nr:hypothetical protein [bacterium]
MQEGIIPVFPAVSKTSEGRFISVSAEHDGVLAVLRDRVISEAKEKTGIPDILQVVMDAAADWRETAYSSSSQVFNQTNEDVIPLSKFMHGGKCAESFLVTLFLLDSLINARILSGSMTYDTHKAVGYRRLSHIWAIFVSESGHRYVLDAVQQRSP